MSVTLRRTRRPRRPRPNSHEDPAHSAHPATGPSRISLEGSRRRDRRRQAASRPQGAQRRRFVNTAVDPPPPRSAWRTHRRSLQVHHPSRPGRPRSQFAACRVADGDGPADSVVRVELALARRVSSSGARTFRSSRRRPFASSACCVWCRRRRENGSSFTCWCVRPAAVACAARACLCADAWS